MNSVGWNHRGSYVAELCVGDLKELWGVGGIVTGNSMSSIERRAGWDGGQSHGMRGCRSDRPGLNPSSTVYRQPDLCNLSRPQFSSSVKGTITPMLHRSLKVKDML